MLYYPVAYECYSPDLRILWRKICEHGTGAESDACRESLSYALATTNRYVNGQICGMKVDLIKAKDPDL
jgi:hypothetical protein